MQNLKVGTTVLILGGSWRHEGKKARILSITEARVEVEISDFLGREVIELAPDQVGALDQVEPVVEGPFHTGDRVFFHEAAYGQEGDLGQVGRVLDVFPAWQKCLVRLDEEEDSRLIKFFDLSLLSPERRLPDEDYLRAIVQAVPRRGYWRRYNEWWQQQADKKLWRIDELPDLYAASLEIEAQINAEIAAEVERQSQLLVQAFDGLTHAQMVEKWQAEWYSWTEFRSYLNEHSPEEKLLRAIFGEGVSEEVGEAEPEKQAEEPEEQGQDYGYRNSGPELLERCEKYMKWLAQPEGYAYDAVPFRGSVDAVTVDPLTILAYTPTLPQNSLHLTEPLIFPSRELALTLLSEEGEHFTAALAGLASDADEAAVALLLEKYKALRAREGTDDWNRRYRLTESVALALVATRHGEAIDAVIKEKLDLKFWGDGSPYGVQGVMFKGDARAFFWDEENPWGIRADEGVQAAIARIWAPVAHHAPRFVALLCEYTLGLALFKHEEMNQYYLGYLHLVPFPSYELRERGLEDSMPSDTSIAHLIAWLDRGDICLLLGYPPHDPNDDGFNDLSRFRLPLALRELYAIHGGLQGGGGRDIDSLQGVH
ncbi:MAG TPA: hypothetical protein VFN35_04615, partial [Ktedonobacteraceae bacterium]|nr:hypothetical protein [Ktedonobacteraceae bacterium]